MLARRGLDYAQAGRDGHYSRWHMLGRCEGEASFKAFLGASEDLLKNIHGVAKVAELDGDELGYLLGKVAEIKRQK